MARSQSDGERENEGRAADAADRVSLLEFLVPSAKVERASLSSFLTPPPSSRRSEAPPSSKSAPALVASEQESGVSKRFWDSPVPRRSSVAPPETVAKDASFLAAEETPPVLAPRPFVPDAPLHEPPVSPAAPTAVAAAEDDESAEQLSTRDFISTPVPGQLSALRAGESEPAAQTPSTLAPSAYDTSADEREIDDWERKSLGGQRRARAPVPAVMVGLVAAGAVLLIVVGLALRKGSSPSAATASAPEAAKIEIPRAAAAMELAPVVEESAPPAPADPAMARELQQRARDLLVAGQIVEGVLFARRAIAANPGDSDSYILLAAGLEDLGRWEEARNIFNQCVRRSGGTATVECRYFANNGN